MTRRARIAVVGLPYFASRAAKELTSGGMDAHHVPRPSRDPRQTAAGLLAIARADAVYAIGSDIVSNSMLDVLARLRKRILVHWVGSDVPYAARAAEQGRLSPRLLTGARHLADAPWLADELRPLGIHANVMPLPVPMATGRLLPLPADFRVLMYGASPAHRAYDTEGMLECVRALPSVSFSAVGAFQPASVPANLDLLGRVADMPSAYARASVFMRLMHHDGLSHSVIEALSFGRHVIWSYPWPGVITAPDPAAAIKAISDLAARHLEGSLTPNIAGEAAVREVFAPDRLVRAVRGELRQLLS